MSDTPLCGHDCGIHGAEPCPRAAGHSGDHLWWLCFEIDCTYHVIVYSGTNAYERRKRARGRFSDPPDITAVRHLLEQLSPLRRRELDRRTPVSEPEPPYQAVRVEVQRKPGWSQLALATPNEKGHIHA